jgi:hypothetical protein
VQYFLWDISWTGIYVYPFLFCRYEDHPSEKATDTTESKTEVKKEK